MGSYNYYKMFGCFNRKFKISEAGPTPDVIEAFVKYSKKESHLTADQMLRFLIEFQGDEDRTLSDVHKIIHGVLQHRHHSTTMFSSDTLTLDDFFYYLFHDVLNGPIKTEVHHDMTAPLQHYFIYTGHNSYLTGNQLSSDCSDVPIIKALERGVRAIELDIWPNSAKDGINVLHGRTLTAPVPLIKCLKSIKDHAFVKSPYPVIITLEDHLTPSLQAKVAEMLIEIFGDSIYYPEVDCIDEFPSPESLKHRFILSTKPPKEYLESKNSKDKETSPMGKDSSEEELTSASSEPQDAIDKNESDPEDEDGDSNQRKSCQPCVNEYKRLIAIHAGKPKKGLRLALTAGLDKVRRLSVSEQELEKAATSYGPDVVRFTQNNLLRVYPKGTRISSSNYKPVTGWMHGAQMVAFNMQGYGKFLWLMHGMFRANGGCGYLKKPDFLIKKGESDDVFDPRAPLPVKTTLRVKVYMGDGWRLDFSQTHFDAFSPPDFYTKDEHPLCVACQNLLQRPHTAGHPHHKDGSIPYHLGVAKQCAMHEWFVVLSIKSPFEEKQNREGFAPKHILTYWVGMGCDKMVPKFTIKDVHIFGAPADFAKKKTRIKEDDWAPTWDEEFTFPLTVPEIALLRIVVREYDRSEKDDFGGQTCLPISELRPGIRAVPLYDKKGKKFKSVKLLMRFQFI